MMEEKMQLGSTMCGGEWEISATSVWLPWGIVIKQPHKIVRFSYINKKWRPFQLYDVFILQ